MEKLKIILAIVSCALIISFTYIIIEKVEFCETTRNESNYTGYNSGFDKGFDQGKINATNNLIVAMNQRNIFPDLNFQTSEFNWKTMDQMCEG